MYEQKYDLFRYTYLMADAVKAFNKDLVVFSLNELPEGQLKQIEEILHHEKKLTDKVSGFSAYINQQNLVELYRERLDVTNLQGNPDLNAVGYLIGDEEYKFIKATETTEYFTAGKYYSVSYLNSDKAAEGAKVTESIRDVAPDKQFLVFQTEKPLDPTTADGEAMAKLVDSIVDSFYIFKPETTVTPTWTDAPSVVGETDGAVK